MHGSGRYVKAMEDSRKASDVLTAARAHLNAVKDLTEAVRNFAQEARATNETVGTAQYATRAHDIETDADAALAGLAALIADAATVAATVTMVARKVDAYNTI